MRRLLVATVVVLAAATFAGPAGALTKKQADAIALRVLHPTKGRVPSALFGLPKPVEANQSVAAASERRLGLEAGPKLRAAGRRVWVYWLDLALGAKFEHPGRILLVDDRTGATGRPVATRWYPLIDGRRPAYLRSPAAYLSRRYHVWESFRTTRKKSSARHTSSAGTRLPRGAMKDDCLLMFGAYNDPLMANDFRQMDRFAGRVGMRSWYTSPGLVPVRSRPGPDADPPGGQDLQTNVDTLVDTLECKDILIYVSGHGAGRAGGTVPAVFSGDLTALAPFRLEETFAKHPDITFKLKIDSCFAARFLDDTKLKEHKNLLVVEASSSAEEPSYGSLRDDLLEPFHVTREVATRGEGEFTHSNVVGLERIVESAAEVKRAQLLGGSLLAQLLARAFDAGQTSDAARQLGWTHPVLWTNPSPSTAPPLPPPPTGVAATEQASHTHPSPNPGYSYVCDKITASAGATVTFGLTGPGGYAGTVSYTLPAGTGDKEHIFGFKITSTGKYDYTIDVQKGSASKRLTGSYTVPALTTATGPFICPPP